ncbi:single-strand DNA endonuclease 1 isoform X2 [Silene latifolia]
MGSEFSCMIREAKALATALGIPCLDGVEEAEAQCALLNSESLCDGCFTSDSDIFLFGAKTVYRDICLGEGGYIVCYEMKEIEKKLRLGRRSLIALALLLGSDYSHGVRGFGPETACQVVRSIGEDAVLRLITSEGLSFLKTLKSSKKNVQSRKSSDKENYSECHVKDTGCQQHLGQDNEALQVIDAYMKPKCHPADSEPVYRVLAVHAFQRNELQEICAKFFEWPPEKTDEYILPKIAERNLRRFANLRSSSSRLGVALPLHEMPVNCPISEVLKHRRIKCVDCFEVSWEDLDGLKSSVVPADLVESACPEKIAEFKERKAQEKKQKNKKPRSKKSDEKASLPNVDLKLQNLLLEIESDSNARRENSLRNSRQDSDSTHSSSVVDLTVSDMFFNEECESKIVNGSEDYQPDPPNVVAMDIVDLLSPSPEVKLRYVSKCQGNTELVNVIDLSDSDMEISPEHARKARDLRLFLASIREEISQ